MFYHQPDRTALDMNGSCSERRSSGTPLVGDAELIVRSRQGTSKSRLQYWQAFTSCDDRADTTSGVEKRCCKRGGGGGGGVVGMLRYTEEQIELHLETRKPVCGRACIGLLSHLTVLQRASCFVIYLDHPWGSLLFKG